MLLLLLIRTLVLDTLNILPCNHDCKYNYTIASVLTIHICMICVCIWIQPWYEWVLKIPLHCRVLPGGLRHHVNIIPFFFFRYCWSWVWAGCVCGDNSWNSWKCQGLYFYKCDSKLDTHSLSHSEIWRRLSNRLVSFCVIWMFALCWAFMTVFLSHSWPGLLPCTWTFCFPH